jgi:hypothetical protein
MQRLRSIDFPLVFERVQIKECSRARMASRIAIENNLLEGGVAAQAKF